MPYFSVSFHSFINPDTEIRGRNKPNKTVGPGRLGPCCFGGDAELTPCILALPSGVQQSVLSGKETSACLHQRNLPPSLLSTLWGVFILAV